MSRDNGSVAFIAEEVDAAPISRITMVGTSLWDWPLTTASVDRLVALLRHMLETPNGGRAWLRRPEFRSWSDPRDDPDRRASALAEVVVSLQYEGPEQPGEWVPGRTRAYYDTVKALGDELRVMAERVQRGSMTAAEAAEQINGMPIRVHLEGAQAGKCFGLQNGPIPYHVCIHVGCTTSQDTMFCQVAISVWSHAPFSSSYGPYQKMAPDDKAFPGPANGVVAIAEQVVNFFRADVFAGITRELHTYFTPTDLTVQNRAYFSPMFWALIPAPEHPDPAAPDGTVGDVARQLLSADRLPSSAVAASDMRGEVSVFRRVIPVQGRADFPSYVLVPHFVGPGGPTSYARQEQLTGDVISGLVRSEVEVAAALYEADGRLTVLEHYARVYNAFAEKAASLWDALAMHLPMSDGRTLDEVHKIIQLMHQILLQGVVDLEWAEGEIERTLGDLSERKARIEEQLRRDLPGDPLRGWPTTVGQSLFNSGYLDFESRHLREAARTIKAINRNCTELLNSMMLAFDERRARELDRLQRSNSLLSGVLTILTLISVLDFTFDASLVVHGTARAVPLVVSWLIEIGVLAWVIAQARTFRRDAQLASAQFKALYDRVRRFQRTVSTDQLASTMRAHRAAIGSGRHTPAEEAAAEQAWAEFDAELVDQLAGIWQDIEKLAAREPAADTTQPAVVQTPQSDELAQLRLRVEIWGLQSTLFTERPLYLHEYPLPGLVCAYAMVSTRRASLMQSPLFGDVYNAVSELDVLRTLRQVGYPIRDARRFHQWLTDDHDNRHPIGDELARIRDFKLRPHMPEGDRDAILRRVLGAD